MILRVILHGWVWHKYTNADEPNQVHIAEFSDRTPDGWCVFNRTEDAGDDEQDFDDYEAAVTEAERRAAEFSCPWYED